MRVIHIIESLGMGGAEQLLVATLPELRRRGVITSVAVLRPPYDLALHLEGAGIEVLRLNQGSKWRLLRSAQAVEEFCPDADVWHAHLYFPTAVTALARLARTTAAATCVTFHNLAYDGANRRSWRLQVKRLLLAFLAKRGFDQVQAVSGAVADHAQRHLGVRDISVLANGIDLTITEKRFSDIGSGIVVPGRLVREKGHHDFLDAISLLSPLDDELVLAGDGPLGGELRERARELGLSVRFTGALPHKAMLRTMREARLVVVPSRFEGFGLTALEALALGVPVVASDAGGLPEVLGPAGMAFPRGDVQSLAASISRALSDQTWRDEQLTAGPAQAARFSLARVAAQQEAIYRALLRERR